MRSPDGHRGFPGRDITPLRIATGVVAVLVGLCMAGPAGSQVRSRLDPQLRSLMARLQEGRALGLSAAKTVEAASAMFPGTRLLPGGERIGVDCFMKLDAGGEAALRAHGLAPRGRMGDIVTITVPEDALELLESIEGIRHVEMARRLKPCLDVSRTNIRATEVHGALAPPYPAVPLGYTGRNVVVGVVDTGVDPLHADFRDDASLTRIEYLWDQTASGTAPDSFSYGVEWTATHINNNIVSERDYSGHGTHVLGILAGDGSDTGNGQPAFKYIGIAPEAPIVAVKTEFLTTNVADGVAYIFQKAGSRDAVVNLSLGTQDGPHDGTSLFDQSLANLLGPGRILVVAAGNEGGSNLHARVSLAGADSAVISFVVPTYTPNPGSSPVNDYLVIDGWYESVNSFSVRVQSPAGHRSREVLSNADSQALCISGSSEGRVYIENNKTANLNGDREIYIEATDGAVGSSCGTPAAGTWKIIAYRKGTVTAPGVIDFWVATAYLGSGGAYPEFVLGASDDYLVGSPASAPGAISVGAFVTKRMWTSVNGPRQYSDVGSGDIGRIASFSSPGPLRDGSIAPIMAAPGMGIAAARSASATVDNNFALLDGKHYINQGTSQAAPHVAGTAALILEAHPHETPAQIITRLSQTALRDAFTGAVPGNLYGYGKLNALDAMTPVLLSAFEAVPGEGTIRLRWVAGGDSRLIGFHVLRGESRDGPFTRLTSALLAGGPEYVYVDAGVAPGLEYWYLLEGITAQGAVERFGPVAAGAGALRFRLGQNGPNPFTARTTIPFALPVAGPARLQVFDLRGRLVRTLLDQTLVPGEGAVEWDGLDEAGRPAPGGIYFYRFSTTAGSETRKMILRR